MFCTNCGAQVDESQKFCTNCGTPVALDSSAQPTVPVDSSTSGIDVMATPAGQAVTASHPSPSPSQYPAQGTAVMSRVSEAAQVPTTAVAPQSVSSSTSTRTVLLVVIVVLLILIVAAFALFFGLQLGSKDAPSTPATSSQSSAAIATSSSSSSSSVTSSDSSAQTSSSSSSSSAANKLPTSNKYYNFTADYVCPDSNTRILSRGEISSWSEEKCNIARNEIYARHGRIFDDANYREYFGSKSWYKGTIPAASFDAQSVLSDVEKANADLLLAFENERGYALS